MQARSATVKGSMAANPQTPLASPASTQGSGAGVSPEARREPINATEAPVNPPAPVWLQRLSLVVLVLFCFYLGVILLVLPWLRAFWDNNALMMDYPRLHHIAIMGPVRGIVSGLGVLDLWIGISELIHYRDYRE